MLKYQYQYYALWPLSEAPRLRVSYEALHFMAHLSLLSEPLHLRKKALLGVVLLSTYPHFLSDSATIVFIVINKL